MHSPVRIASYNIHGGIGIDRHFVPKRIVGVLSELRADIIALQEVESRRTGFDMLGYLARETGYHAVAGPTLFMGAAITATACFRAIARSPYAASISVSPDASRGAPSTSSSIAESPCA